MFLIRSIKAYLCQNMINLDVVDFSEHRSEEVAHFFDAQCALSTSFRFVYLFQFQIKSKKMIYKIAFKYVCHVQNKQLIQGMK